MAKDWKGDEIDYLEEVTKHLREGGTLQGLSEPHPTALKEETERQEAKAAAKSKETDKDG